MSYYSIPEQKTAGIIRYSCGILFMLFSFCYLFFLEGEILAEAQFVFSKGVTSYDIMTGAILITLVLQLVQAQQLLDLEQQSQLLVQEQELLQLHRDLQL